MEEVDLYTVGQPFATPSGGRKRVAVLTSVESDGGTQVGHEIVLLQNFFDELLRRVPTAKLRCRRESRVISPGA